jgi:hypothetical protein
MGQAGSGGFAGCDGDGAVHGGRGERAKLVMVVAEHHIDESLVLVDESLVLGFGLGKHHVEFVMVLFAFFGGLADLDERLLLFLPFEPNFGFSLFGS